MRSNLVKQMIVDVLNEKHGFTYHPYMGFGFERCRIAPDYNTLTKYGLHKDSIPYKCGVVSIASNELRGTK